MKAMEEKVLLTTEEKEILSVEITLNKQQVVLVRGVLSGLIRKMADRAFNEANINIAAQKDFFGRVSEEKMEVYPRFFITKESRSLVYLGQLFLLCE